MGNIDEEFDKLLDKIQFLSDKNQADQTKLIVTISWAGSVLYISLAQISLWEIVSSILFSCAILSEFLACCFFKKFADNAYEVSITRKREYAIVADKYNKFGERAILVRNITFIIALLFFIAGLLTKGIV